MTYFRNPEVNSRPAFADILIPLQKPDFQILKWSSEEKYSEEAMVLGSPLDKGHSLHKDLQRSYLAANETPNKENGTSANKDGAGREGKDSKKDSEGAQACTITKSEDNDEEESGYVVANMDTASDEYSIPLSEGESVPLSELNDQYVS